MKRTLPPLNSLRAFEAAARHHSVSGAAEELNVSPGALSRHVRKLEEYIGTPLFKRTKTGLILTREGMNYAMLASDVFDTLHDGTTRLRGDSKRLVVKLRVTPTVAIHWLMPRLALFYGAHPEVDTHITTAYDPVDFDRHDAHLGIRLGSGDWPEVESYQVLLEELLPLCAPDLQRQPLPKVPRDLSAHVLLHSAMRPNDWRNWCAAHCPDLDSAKGLRLENSVMAYQAAKLGMGIAITHSSAFFENELRFGQFVAPFGRDAIVATGNAYYLVRPRHRPLKGPVRLLWDWLHSNSGAS